MAVAPAAVGSKRKEERSGRGKSAREKRPAEGRLGRVGTEGTARF